MNLILPILADVSSGSGLVNAVITVIIVALIFGLCWWLLDYLALPEPFAKIVRAVLAIVAVIFLANFLLSLTGHGFIHW